MTVTVVAGNPKPGSRTLAAATLLARLLTDREPDHVVDVVTLGPSLLGWGDDGVKAAVATVAASDLVVVASPTYKGSITGVLKCFLDQVAAGGWSGVTAVPLMLGGGPAHTLAPEYALVPVLTELGASVPTRGLYVLDSAWEDPATYQPWLDAWRPTLRGPGVGPTS
ncbi:NADPH-dependent FMN reductase [Jatrophihabitans sp. YIM 134969]